MSVRITSRAVTASKIHTQHPVLFLSRSDLQWTKAQKAWDYLDTRFGRKPDPLMGCFLLVSYSTCTN
jgi:hypothetical protein